MKYGEPDWKASREDEITELIDKETERRIVVTIEEWTYIFGPNKWMYLLRFENSRLVKIETRGYGY